MFIRKNSYGKSIETHKKTKSIDKIELKLPIQQKPKNGKFPAKNGDI